MIRFAGIYVERIAQPIDDSTTKININQGNVNPIGNYVNSALCMLIVNPTIIPTNIPIMQLENTKVKASYI
jgi:hypothetical protein